MFPSNAIFPDFGVVGVSMFFMSCIVSQLTFTLGGSIFKAGNGSMMIEAVPFFHILVNTITAEVGEENPHVIIATTMAAFAFSSFLTGAVFFGLGKFKLGALVGFFPRSILIGAIGGVGVFLIETGLEVAAGIEGEGIDFTHNTYVQLFGSAHNVLLWAIPLFLALFLRLISLRYTHELVFPAYFLVVPIIFYIVIAIIGVDFETLRKNRWVFEVGQVKEPWYTFYSYYDFRQVHWGAFWKSMSTQFALVFFGILHVPLNVPALGVSLCEDNVKLDRELIAHGYSNILSGCVGSVPNYLCYVNTVLFYRVGGGTRLAALMLAAATAGIMVAGPSVIGFLPIMVVAALIFVLGLDLAKEAVWDTRHKVNRWEYVTIVAITIGMTIWDFVIGLFIGIVMACIFFVIQNSKRRAIRAAFNGSVARSTVRRPASQSAFIKDVGRQTQVVKLQGFLFFGTISAVEGEIRNMLDIAVWQHNPIRFLIVDLWLVYGLDLSSAEAFVRIQRLLEAKGVVLVFCGCHPEGVVGKALQAVELWSDQGNNSVQVVDTLNDALEWTENNYLSAFYGAPNRKLEQQPAAREFNIASSQVPFSLGESHENSPRRKHLVQAGDLTFKSSDIHLRHEPSSNGSLSPNPTLSLAPPLPTLLKTFRTYTDLKEDFWFQLVPYLESVHAKQGQILWSQGDEPDGMYLIESGMLRAVYEYAEHTRLVQETMVSGVVAGELSTLAGTPRNATVTVEVPSVLWKLDNTKLEKLQKNHPKVAAEFIRILLKITSQEHDVLSAHLMTTLS
ncbi:vacuole protein [Phaffia rhodozyma]|uniref:Vacuole protein n=1 Tax=Phaffia rhodozyma TaxID=264483 RepID=A0A0F7SFC4_PHARH|nr:vacuole protein [Phaffia rhodozyma]